MDVLRGVDLSGQEEGHRPFPLDVALGGLQLRGCPVTFGIDPAPPGLFYGALMNTVDDPGCPVVVGGVFLTWSLSRAHHEKAWPRMAVLFVNVQVHPAIASLRQWLELLLQPPGFR